MNEHPERSGNLDGLGLDIGGAHLKAASHSGRALSRPLAIWRERERLCPELEKLLAQFESPGEIRVTMTAEICDCFLSRREGVLEIIDATARAARNVHPGARLRFFALPGTWLDPDASTREPLRLAASNWLALAYHVAREYEIEEGLLVDLGSTTTDIIPLVRGVPVHPMATDTDRLLDGRLLYLGLRRTPVFALVKTLPLPSAGLESCPVIPELFATVADALLLAGELPADPENLETADGQPFTGEASHRRLARCIGLDAETLELEDARSLARHVSQEVILRLREGIRRQLERLPRGTPPNLVIAGEGEEFLARQVIPGDLREQLRLIRFSRELDPAVSTAACAFALTQLPASPCRPD